MYTPTNPQGFNPEQSSWIREELAQIEKAQYDAADFLVLALQTAPPTKIEARMVVYADGVFFNPGSGEGIYRRNNANTAWVFVG